MDDIKLQEKVLEFNTGKYYPRYTYVNKIENLQLIVNDKGKVTYSVKVAGVCHSDEFTVGKSRVFSREYEIFRVLILRLNQQHDLVNAAYC